MGDLACGHHGTKSLRSCHICSGGGDPVRELRREPGVAALPLYRLRDPLPHHAGHQPLPLLSHELLLHQGIR